MVVLELVKQAINSFVYYLVETCFVSFDFFQDSLEDRIRNLKSKFDNIKIADEISKLESITTEEEFIEFLYLKVNGNFDSLVEICRTYGDSYYEDGWNIQIDEHDLI